MNKVNAIVYEQLLEQYENLSEETKKALLIYKSKLFYFINEIAQLPNFLNESATSIFNKVSNKNIFLEKYNDYKKVINLTSNMFIKKTIFNNIDFTNVFTFIDSLKLVYQTLKTEALILDDDLMVYRIVSVDDDNVLFISKSDIVSTSVNIDVLDDFMIHKYNHLYRIHIEAGASVLVTPYSVLINLLDDQLTISKKAVNQQEVILFKDSTEFIENNVKEKEIENSKLYIHDIKACQKSISNLNPIRR